MRFNLKDIPDAIAHAEGFPRLRWDYLQSWLDANVSDVSRPDVEMEAVYQWLERLADELGEAFWINSAKHCVLLTSQSEPSGDDLLRFAEQVVEHLLRVLDLEPTGGDAMKHVIIRLDSVESYYSYLAYHYPEGEYGGSSGVFINDGLHHIVFHRTPHGIDERIMAHELCHAELASFDVPLWVQEGIAQIVERQVTRVYDAPLNHEAATALREHWQRSGLDAFWSGASFSAPGDAQGFSYLLAQILVSVLIADHKPTFLDFLYDADPADAGDAAAREHFGKSLADIAAGFLGSTAGGSSPEQ
ncbi:MAG: hypothetical protein H6817_08565 [Phycisphaerales bacterium]|nr:hypothetical protein [Phycisphaerales bacterium]